MQTRVKRQAPVSIPMCMGNPPPELMLELEKSPPSRYLLICKWRNHGQGIRDCAAAFGWTARPAAGWGDDPVPADHTQGLIAAARVKFGITELSNFDSYYYIYQEFSRPSELRTYDACSAAARRPAPMFRFPVRMSRGNDLIERVDHGSRVASRSRFGRRSTPSPSLFAPRGRAGARSLCHNSDIRSTSSCAHHSGFVGFAFRRHRATNSAKDGNGKCNPSSRRSQEEPLQQAQHGARAMRTMRQPDAALGHHTLRLLRWRP